MNAQRAHLRVVPPPNPEPQRSQSAERSAPPSPEALYRAHAKYVAAIGLRMLGRDSEVDDLVQDVFVRAVRHASVLREPGAARGWLATTTVRLAMRRLRARRVRAFLGFDEVGVADELSLVSRDAGPEQRAFVKRLYEVLESVPAGARVAWTLRYLEGEKLEAVAELCACSLATAKRRIAKAHAIIEGAVGV